MLHSKFLKGTARRNVLAKLFSSIETQTVASSRLPYFRCSEHNPVNHDISHVGQYYTVSPEAFQLLFTTGGLNDDFRKNVKTFNECAIMVRNPAVEVMKCLHVADYSNPVIRYCLYGRLGTGKTITLSHLIHFAAQKNWLIVHGPWAPKWIRYNKEIIPSQSRPGRMDQPEMATIWLQHFKAQNLNLIKSLDLKTTQDYTWSKREVTEKGKPLTEIVDQGLNRIKFSSDCVAVLLKEIKIHASEERVRVFVALDGINSFFGPSQVKREDKSPVDANDITLVHAFKKMLRNDWKNGAVVVTVDKLGNIVEHRELDTPRYLLGKDGWEAMDPFVPIHIKNFTKEETMSCLDYFFDRRWIQTEGANSEQGKAELRFLSGDNPRNLAEICAPW